jgi:hypothetical protein
MKPATPGRRAYDRALYAMRNMQAQGWQSEALLVDHAAQVLGGTDEAKRIAQDAYAAISRSQPQTERKDQ